MKVEWVPLRELLELKRDPITVNAAESYSRIGIFSWGKGMLRREPASGAEMGSMRYFTFPIPSLVFSNIQAWEGAVALASPEDADHVCSSRFYPYVPREGADVELAYLLEYFRSASGLAVMRRSSPGTQVRNKVLSKSMLESSLLPVPAKRHQVRIAAHLSALVVHAAGSEDRLPVGPDDILTKTVRRVSAGQPRRPLGELLARNREWLRLDPLATYRPIGIRGFGRGLISYPETDADSLSKLRYFQVVPGNLLVSNIKAWEGAVCLAAAGDDDRIGSNRFLQYEVVDPTVITEWVERYLLSPEGVSLLGAASPGSADRNRTLSMEGFEAIEIPVPPLDSQQAIAAIARTVARAGSVSKRRNTLAAAILPAARNEIFNAMR